MCQDLDIVLDTEHAIVSQTAFATTPKMRSQ